MKPDFPALEADMLKTWEAEKTFQQSLDLRQGQQYFSFYDGPPFANGLPHYGHVVPSTIKDAVARYKTMRNYYVPRVAGWDTHGLPVEYEVEKQMGISGKRQILDLGVDKFNQACRDSVFKYKTEIEDFIRRLGRWVDLDHAYATLDDNYIESVWWVFSQLHQKGLIYQGFRSMPYCPRCATPLSNFELNQGYQDGVEDPSVFVKFPIVDKPEIAFLAWTTTPWTLPANVALAVDPTADYVTVELQDDGDSWQRGGQLILAKSRLEELSLRQAEYKVVQTQKGSQLVGLKYQPLYHSKEATDKDYQIIAATEVSLDDGTGVLHVAPRYGEADLRLGQEHGLALVESVDSNGLFKAEVEPRAAVGLFFKDADPVIIEDLTKQGRLFAAETFTHIYPFCWRCDTPLFYFATPSWFVAVTKVVDQLVANNQKIGWVPAHIGDGRFGNWLAEARDWGISRNRFWGSPIPVWQCANDHNTVIGSLEELTKLAVNMPKDLDLHRPGIDAIELKCSDCDQPAKRIEEVFDCWFESGSMPYASQHYPFENQAEFKNGFPAEFISEGLDQTRGWFYTLHVLATALFDQPAYNHVICHGIVVAADGKKLSKRLKNYPPLEEVFDHYGADSLRYFMLSSPVTSGEDVRFSKDALQDTQRNVFMTLWNVFSFYQTYAGTEQWQPAKQLATPNSANLLDQWMLSRLSQATAEITKQADAYQLSRAIRPLTELIDDLSNWYLRRSRRRFWKNDDMADKTAAFATLHYVLVQICQLLAPWSPFMSDKLWRELTAGMDAAKSVHLSDWPEVQDVDSKLLDQMANVRSVITEGLAVRAAAGVKVRQPLSAATITGPGLPAELLDLAKDELNVKSIEFKTSKESVPIKIDTNLTPELKQEGLARDLIRQIQDKRKQAGLKVDDRIKVQLATKDQDLQAAVNQYKELISGETGTTELKLVDEVHDQVPVRMAGVAITIDVQPV